MLRTAKRSDRAEGLLPYGTAAMLAAVTFLLVASPVGAASVHSSVTLSAPYRGTVSTPSSYAYANGCTVNKVLSPQRWSGTSGTETEAVTAKAITCPKTLGNLGLYSNAYQTASLEIGLPFKVASNGNHSILSSWTIQFAVTESMTKGGCPSPKVVYPPPANSASSSQCYASANWNLEVATSVVDLNNATWYGNFSYSYAYNDSYWYNDTYCYNYGTPTCSNSSSGNSYGYAYGYNYAGKLAGGGPVSLAEWTNGTKMVRSHHYALLVSIYVDVGAYAVSSNLKARWVAMSLATINMATLGNGAKLGSIVIH